MDKAISNLTVPLGEMKDQVMVCIFILDNEFHKGCHIEGEVLDMRCDEKSILSKT